MSNTKASKASCASGIQLSVQRWLASFTSPERSGTSLMSSPPVKSPASWKLSIALEILCDLWSGFKRDIQVQYALAKARYGTLFLLIGQVQHHGQGLKDHGTILIPPSLNFPAIVRFCIRPKPDSLSLIVVMLCSGFMSTLNGKEAEQKKGADYFVNSIINKRLELKDQWLRDPSVIHYSLMYSSAGYVLVHEGKK